MAPKDYYFEKEWSDSFSDFFVNERKALWKYHKDMQGL